MSSSGPSIPVRTSSKRVLERRELRLKISKHEIKRKLSEVSFEASPIIYRKLRIEELQCDHEEQAIHKSWLDVEYDQGGLDEKAYRRARREANVRIVSLQAEMWDERKILRQAEETAGIKPELGPDTQGAFICTLLALYKDRPIPSKRSSTEQSGLRKAAIKTYDSEKGAPKGKLWCPVSQEYFDDRAMVAAHIVPRRLAASVVEYVFGEGAGTRINTTDNCLILHQSVEQSFDNGNFVLLPADSTESPIRTWKIQITNNAAKNTDFGRKTLIDMNGQTVSFKNDKRPAARFLYFHFVITLLRNKRDRQPGWEEFMATLATTKPFATPGHYMRQSMLLILAKGAGELDGQEDAKLLGEVGQETFEDERGALEEGEEAEIGRRALVTYSRKKDGLVAEEDDGYENWEHTDEDEDEDEPDERGW